jgi:hypothetical protein
MPGPGSSRERVLPPCSSAVRGVLVARASTRQEWAATRLCLVRLQPGHTVRGSVFPELHQTPQSTGALHLPEVQCQFHTSLSVRRWTCHETCLQYPLYSSLPMCALGFIIARFMAGHGLASAADHSLFAPTFRSLRPPYPLFPPTFGPDDSTASGLFSLHCHIFP